MRAVFKFFTRLLFGVLFLMISFTLGINLYFNFSGTKERLLLQAQEALGKSFEVGWIYLLPWSGLHIEGVKITDATHALSVRVPSLFVKVKDLLTIAKNSQDWRGTLHINKVFLNDRLVLKQTVAVLSKTKDTFSVESFVGKALGGKVQGALMLQNSAAASSPYQGSISFFNIGLKEALAETNLQQKVSAGKVQGKIDITGMTGKPESLRGSGTVELIGAALKTGDFFGSLSSLFPVEELRLLKLHEAKANYIFSSDTLRITSSRVKTENMAITAQGNIRRQGEVDLNAQLFLSGKLAKHFAEVLPPELAATASQIGYCEIPFKVYGSVTQLRTDFFKQILKQQLQNNVQGIIEGVLQNVLK